MKSMKNQVFRPFDTLLLCKERIYLWAENRRLNLSDRLNLIDRSETTIFGIAWGFIRALWPLWSFCKVFLTHKSFSFYLCALLLKLVFFFFALSILSHRLHDNCQMRIERTSKEADVEWRAIIYAKLTNRLAPFLEYIFYKIKF